MPGNATPLPGNPRYIGYPLTGKKHSPLIPKAAFEKILAKDPDYQRMVKLEMDIADAVMAVSAENKVFKREINQLYRKVVTNDRKVWGNVRQKAAFAHARRSCALRIYRHALADALTRGGEWKNSYDTQDDEGGLNLTDDYQKDINRDLAALNEPDGPDETDENFEGGIEGMEGDE
jgi:hypothetical protein